MRAQPSGAMDACSTSGRSCLVVPAMHAASRHWAHRVCSGRPAAQPWHPQGVQTRLHSQHEQPMQVACRSAASVPSGAAPFQPETPLSQKIASFLDAFWKFLRPHTIRGTLLGTTALTTRALLETPALIDWGLLPKALMGLLALLCGNGYIVGINQIYDVDIDKVNKPFLPVAAGELSPGLAWVLCMLLATCGAAIVALNFGSLISALYGFGLFLGTIYSVPPLRLKRFAVPAFMIIAVVRGVLLNFGVYYSTKAALGVAGPFAWTPPISFITFFVTLFAVVIAITKDLPDIEGDKANGIETFATRMGVKAVSFAGSGLLLTNYAVAVWLAIQPSMGFNTFVMAGAHSLLALLLIWRTFRLDQDGYKQEAILSFYRWIWTLFYCEYAMFPFI